MTITATTTTWGRVTDGTAVGTVERIEISGCDEAVAITPLWSDAEGVVIDLFTPDAPLDLDAVRRLAEALDRLRATPPPQ